MTKIIATLVLLFVMFSNLNATETQTPKNDTNCTVEKCKTKQTNDTNCTTVKCKKNTCTDCDGKGCEKCKTLPKWSVSKDANSTVKMPSCCKNKKKAEEKAPMKCGAGKCGGGK